MSCFEGRVALVTGAASGIGRALGQALVREGARLILVDQSPESLSEPWVDALSGDENMTSTMDTRDRVAWNDLADRILERESGVDFIFNNAGISMPRRRIGEGEPELWDRVIGINLTGVFNGCHTYLQRLRRPGNPGYIINTASVCAFFATAGLSPYSVSKAAVLALSDAIRLERQSEGTMVTAFCPGFVRTAIASNSVADQPNPGPERQAMIERLKAAMPAEAAAAICLDGIRKGRSLVVTHPEYVSVVTARARWIENGFAESIENSWPDDLAVLGSGWLSGSKSI